MIGARRRARRRPTWCSRSAAGSACSRSTSPRGWRTCTWSRWTARSSRRCATRSSRSATRRSTSADAVKLDFGALEPLPDQGRGEPALRRGGDRAAEVDRRAARRRSSGWRWSSARWASGSRPRPAARATAPRSVLAQLACEVRVPAQGAAHASSTPSRTWTPRSWCCAAAAPAPPDERRGARARRLRPPAQGAGRLARARARRAGRHPRRARAPRSSSSATRPTPAPSGCRPATGRGWPTRSAASGSRAATPRVASRRDPRARLREGQPGPPRRAPARRRHAPDLLAVRLARAGRRARRPRRASPARDSVDLPRRARARTSPRGRSREFRSRARPRAARRSRCGSTSASRWPPGSAAGAPTPPRRCAPPTSSPGGRSAPDELLAARRRPRLRRAEPGRARATRSCQGVGEQVEPVELPPLVAVLVPDARRALAPRDVYAELDRLGGCARAARPGAAPRARRRRRRPSWPPALENDLQPAALSLRPELDGDARRASRSAGALGAARERLGPHLLRAVRRRGRRRARPPRRSRARSSPAALTYPPGCMSAREMIAGGGRRAGGGLRRLALAQAEPRAPRARRGPARSRSASTRAACSRRCPTRRR